MAIQVKCSRCASELTSPGGLLFSPPNVAGLCFKSHLCVDCFPAVAFVAVAATEWWGIQDIGGQWWPRRFTSLEEAEAHLQRCRGPGTQAEVRKLYGRL